MSRIELPKQVIKQLIRYIDEGCELELVTEDFNGETINMWIANGNMVLLSAPVRSTPTPTNTYKNSNVKD